MRQTMEFDVERVDEEHCRVTWANGGRMKVATIEEVEAYGLSAPEISVPPRSEYPLQTVKVAAGCPVVNDSGVVLVPAHSLRSGDEVEWAPGDWREIERIGRYGHRLRFYNGIDELTVDSVALVAVRRSGVTG